MSRAFKRNYLQHALALRRWMQRRGAAGGVDPFTFALDLELDGKRLRLRPQFVIEPVSGPVSFVPSLQPGVSGFAGWLPYDRRVWPIAQDKIVFKEHAARQGLRLPKWGAGSEQIRGPYLIKARRSTFGIGLRGPFPASRAPDLAAGEYWEQFVPGRMLKAWFCDAEPAVVELVGLPEVQGDGARTLRQLIAARLAPDTPFPDELRDLSAWQGFSLDTVVPPGRSVIADYRYMSHLNPASVTDHDVRARIAGSPLEAQLRHAGLHCWLAIPPAIRDGTVFSLDGMVDPDGHVWFLEANCNPQLHPAIYDAMLDRAFPSRPDPSKGTPS